jgi:recA bacterial DNA recombination protein
MKLIAFLFIHGLDKLRPSGTESVVGEQKANLLFNRTFQLLEFLRFVMSSLSSHLPMAVTPVWSAKSRPPCEKRLNAMPKLAGVTPASKLAVRPTPEMVSTGIREIDALTGGFPRGCLSEIYGPASSGRTSLLLAALAAATQRKEVCALVDTTDAFDPPSAAAAQVDLEKLLWVRCVANAPRRRKDATKSNGEYCKVEQALRVTDLLLQSGGFGLVAIDLSDVPPQIVRRIPLTSWFRFQRAVEPTPTVLLVFSQAPCARTCAWLLLEMRGQSSVVGRQSPGQETPTHAQLFEGLHIEGELMRSRLERKPVQSVTAAFATKAARAG